MADTSNGKFIKYGIAHIDNVKQYDKVFRGLNPRVIEGFVRGTGVKCVLLTLNKARALTSVLHAIEAYNAINTERMHLVRPLESRADLVLTFSLADRLHSNSFYLEFMLEKKKLSMFSSYWRLDMTDYRFVNEHTMSRIAKELEIDMMEHVVKPSSQVRVREHREFTDEVMDNLKKRRKNKNEDAWSSLLVCVFVHYLLMLVFDFVRFFGRTHLRVGWTFHFSKKKKYVTRPAREIKCFLFLGVLIYRCIKRRVTVDLIQAMSYPFFPCKSCGANVQLSWSCGQRFSLHDVDCLTDEAPWSRTTAELESDDCANNCRGQGNMFARKRKADSLQPAVFVAGSQYNFEGQFEHMCCFCSLRNGLSVLSFSEIGCYHCKTRQILFFEFSRLKRTRRPVDAKALVSTSAWNSQGWGGLTDVLIDYIISLGLNWSEGGLMDI